MNYLKQNNPFNRRQLDDPFKDSDLVRQKKLAFIIDRVKSQIIEAKAKFKNILLGYEDMVVKNKQQTERCISMLAEDITQYKVLKKVYERYMSACHSLLFIKDSMEEAVDTYGESAVFMEEVARRLPKTETIHNIHWRYQELMKLREELAQDAKEVV